MVPHSLVASPRLKPFLDAFAAGKKLVVLTAYDYTQARLAEEAGVDLLLVGDSLGMVEQGRDSTSGVTLDQMVYHTRMAARGRRQVPIVADLPLHSYDDPETAVESSKLLMAAGADAVKFEGNPTGVAQAILGAGIPVMGHLGLLPQTAADFKVRGKDAAEAAQIASDARSLAAAGCFSLVLECVPLGLGRDVTQGLGIPTIGIGAGPETSGQVLVFHDLLGLVDGRKAKFVPSAYALVGEAVRRAVGAWAGDVRQGVYPSDAESYH
ncbi:MAG TPA: 3-methyl-2-oxobutanoate hydroxymethyltransferase [Spirochaetia bacterium]|nr:3-methyl-2-oxobutanoate hydroxymethyltransferase [Spirochaetia bacterium]